MTVFITFLHSMEETWKKTYVRTIQIYDTSIRQNKHNAQTKQCSFCKGTPTKNTCYAQKFNDPMPQHPCPCNSK